jgi:hypothetical protein
MKDEYSTERPLGGVPKWQVSPFLIHPSSFIIDFRRSGRRDVRGRPAGRPQR